MLTEGKLRLKGNNINWINSKAEKIPVKDDVYDYYTISYMVLNVTDINAALKGLRILRNLVDFYVWSFQKIDNEF